MDKFEITWAGLVRPTRNQVDRKLIFFAFCLANWATPKIKGPVQSGFVWARVLGQIWPGFFGPIILEPDPTQP